jgi:hypothetical protein
MGTLGFFLLAAFFALLAFDARKFERSSRHKIWAVPPDSWRGVGVDPLSRQAQEAAQSNKLTAIGGIPGLFWVFVVLSLGCLAGAVWSWLNQAT